LSIVRLAASTSTKRPAVYRSNRTIVRGFHTNKIRVPSTERSLLRIVVPAASSLPPTKEFPISISRTRAIGKASVC
jgi:hypothetical protein